MKITIGPVNPYSKLPAFYELLYKYLVILFERLSIAGSRPPTSFTLLTPRLLPLSLGFTKYRQLQLVENSAHRIWLPLDEVYRISDIHHIEGFNHLITITFIESKCRYYRITSSILDLQHIQVALYAAILTRCAMHSDKHTVKNYLLTLYLKREIIFINLYFFSTVVVIPFFLGNDDLINVVKYFYRGFFRWSRLFVLRSHIHPNTRRK